MIWQARNRSQIFGGARFGNGCYSSIKKGATIAGADVPEKLSIFGPRNWLKMYPFFERAAVDEKQIQNEK